MNRQLGRWPRSQLLPVVLCLAASAFAGEPTWVEVRSPHFSVVTDAGEKRGREVALRFEQMRGAFAALMTKDAKVTLPVPLQIVAFHNSKAMRPYVPLWKGKPVELTGLFQGGEDRSFILVDLSAEDPWRIVFHEYAHQLANGNTAWRMGPWFDEGFAEFFSTIEVDDKQAQVGKVPDDTYRILRGEGMMKISELFRVQRDSKTYNETGDHRTVFYAQSGLLMHYIYDNGLLGKVAAYLDLEINGGVPVEEAIQKAFGMTASQFDKALSNYMMSGRYKYYAIPAPAGIASAAYEARALTEGDAKAVLADAHLHSRDHREEALGEFEEILKLQPDHPAALRGLGYAYLLRQNFQQAGEYFRRTAEHDSNDPRVLYYSAILLQREKGFGMGGDREELAAAQKRLEKAVTLNPEFADAYNVLASIYRVQGMGDEALQAMEKAVALSPRNEFYAFNLAHLYMERRRYDDAIAILEPLRRSENPMIAAQVPQDISRVQAAKAAGASGGAPLRVIRRQASETPLVPEQSVTSTSPSGPAVPPRTIGFLKGKLVSVDCSAAPGAVLNVVAGGKTWKFHVRDTTHVVVIGADRFSCEWTNRPVAFNYVSTGGSEGEAVSVEVQ